MKNNNAQNQSKDDSVDTLPSKTMIDVIKSDLLAIKKDISGIIGIGVEHFELGYWR